MRCQPNRNYVSNDDIQTPLALAGLLVAHFRPSGRVLEPCAGEGNFLRHLPGAEWCEIKQGRDFFEWQEPVDWIITNPPWSRIREFMHHGFEIAENVALLMTVNHVWTKARLRDMKNSGFSIRRFVLLDTPDSFPQSGFQLGMIHFQKAWRGDVGIVDLQSSATGIRPDKMWPGKDAAPAGGARAAVSR